MSPDIPKEDTSLSEFLAQAKWRRKDGLIYAPWDDEDRDEDEEVEEDE